MPTASLLSFDYLHNKGCKRCFKGFLKGLRFTVLVSWGLSLIFVAGLSLSLSSSPSAFVCTLSGMPVEVVRDSGFPRVSVLDSRPRVALPYSTPLKP